MKIARVLGRVVLLLAVLSLPILSTPAFGAPVIRPAAAVVRSASGANPAAIQATVDLFRADLGPNNGVGGTFATGRREINWDGVPDGFSAPNNLPADFFNVNSPRGVVFSTPGTGFQVSADSSNPTSTPVRFGNINATYTAAFKTFSPERLFTSLGSNVVDVTFFIPGTAIRATVRGFGVVFTDVDNDGGAATDVVVLDDLIYGEPHNPATVFAITTGNNLLRFNSDLPGTILSTTAVTGLQAGEAILGIDFRPGTGQLYALGSTSRLYTLNTVTGAATPVTTTAFSPPLNGAEFGFDFNPVPDRIRVVSSANQNLRLNPNTGVATTDTSLAYAATDPNVGDDPSIVGSAYINNFAGAITTTLYGIDYVQDILVMQGGPGGIPSPNGGQLFTVGPTGFVTNSPAIGFDIATNGTAFAAMRVSADTTSKFFTINLATGAATVIAAIGSSGLIRDIAVAPVHNLYLPVVQK